MEKEETKDGKLGARRKPHVSRGLGGAARS